MANNAQIAADVLAAVGGKENVSSVTHCMTRLRFILKDAGIPKDDEVKKIKGVIGVVQAGGQYQVIIGQNVAKVYDEVCKMGGFAASAAINENLDEDKPKEKLTAKKIGSNILNYLSGSMTPFIPVMMAAAMFKTLQVIFGPSMANIFPADSDFYILMGFLYNACFYFLPVYIGFSAAKKLGMSGMMGAYMGCILIAPEWVAMVGQRDSFSVFGFSAPVYNYAQTFIPVILSVWVLHYIERFFKKYIPDTIATIFVPFLSMLVITPIAFCLLAPAGRIIGDALGTGLLFFGDHGGFIAIAVIAAIWEFLVMTGMHPVLVTTAYALLTQNGYDPVVLVASLTATFACHGMAFGASLRLKDKEEKGLAFGYFVSGIIGGVTEPALYGLGLKYKRPFIGLMLGGFAGGLYAGLTHVAVYTAGSGNILALLRYINGGTANFVNAAIGLAIAFFGAALGTYLFGFSKKDLEVTKE